MRTSGRIPISPAWSPKTGQIVCYKNRTCRLLRTRLFAPRSIALVGASPRQGSLGNAILRNLRDAGFPGPLNLVNPRYPEIDGLPVVKSLRDLAGAPDVAVVAGTARSVPVVIAEAAEGGVAAAIIVTAGLGHGPGSLATACDLPPGPKGFAWLALTASASWRPGLGSTRPSPRICRFRATSRLCRSPARSPPPCSTGRKFPRNRFLAHFISLGDSRGRRLRRRASTILRRMPRRRPFSCMSKRSGMHASSCPRRAPPRATNRSSR